MNIQDEMVFLEEVISAGAERIPEEETLGTEVQTGRQERTEKAGESTRGQASTVPGTLATKVVSQVGKSSALNVRQIPSTEKGAVQL